MRININQWAVGQGGFHSGIFDPGYNISRSQEKFVYIFDFGTHSTTSSMNRKQILNRELDKFLEIYGDDYCKIDVLFLSHLDEDHHNGIRDILNDQSKYTIKNLVIPHTELAERLIHLARISNSNRSNIDNEQINVLLNPVNYFRGILGESTRVIEYGDNLDLEIDNDLFKVSNGEIISKDYVWKLKPYMQKSLNTPAIRKIFFKEVQNQMANLGIQIGASENGSDLESEIQKTLAGKSNISIKSLIKLLSNAYTEAGKKIKKLSTSVTWKNLVSLSLYSGPATENLNQHHYCYFCDCPITYWDCCGLFYCDHKMHKITRNCRKGWILTGDSDLKISNHLSNFLNFFKNELQLTSFFSLPHHGSYHNWDLTNFNKLNRNFIYLIEFGTNNQHHHPSGVILHDMTVRKSIFYGITENSRDRFGTHIKVYPLKSK